MNEYDVEELPFDIYKLRIFTIFNNAALHLGAEFQYETPEEKQDFLTDFCEESKRMGYTV